MVGVDVGAGAKLDITLKFVGGLQDERFLDTLYQGKRFYPFTFAVVREKHLRIPRCDRSEIPAAPLAPTMKDAAAATEEPNMTTTSFAFYRNSCVDGFVLRLLQSRAVLQ